MKNHGLIRYATLHCKKDDSKEVIMELDSSEETLAQYPFPFHYEIAYTLKDNKLTITYHITNTGEKEMPFTFGLHPGFNCPYVKVRNLRNTLYLSRTKSICSSWYLILIKTSI